MGCCSSKPSTSSIAQKPSFQNKVTAKLSSEIDSNEVKKPVEEKLGFKKKELFVIQHRRSNDTKSDGQEEVEAILIQCGRLSRNSSSGSGRKYAGSKRSHDFDKEGEVCTDLNCDNNGDIDDEETQTRRQHSRGSHRRRTPSRSRERDAQSQRSGSRERTLASSGGGSRRVSKSPGRRSRSPVTKSGNLGNSAGNSAIRPGKMVSVPATVSIEKNSNGDCNVKRVLVKRNAGEGLAGSRSGTPPRSRSPSLSRSSSRKAEHSPFRRTLLNEIDMGNLPFQPLANRASSCKAQFKCNEVEEVVTQDKLGIDVNYAKVAAQGSNSKGNEKQDMNFYGDKREQSFAQCGPDSMKFPLALSRSRSSRRSRDLDINVEALMNTTPATNYNLLLLQDIQNFHQKTAASTSSSDSNPNANSPFSLPECLSKVSSIVDAVADLNSTKPDNSFTNNTRIGVTNSVDGKKRLEKPSIASEEEDGDNVSEPSMHQYVTVRKRGSGFESFQGGDFDELESLGSNSYTSGSRNHCVSSSSWEPNSVDSTDRWASKSREGVSPVSLDRHDFSSNRAR